MQMKSSVSDADREIPTLKSTDNAGNSVNLVSGIIRLPSGRDISVCINYFSYLLLNKIGIFFKVFTIYVV